MSNMIKVEVYIRTRKVGSECTDVLEFDRAEWGAMTDAQKEEVCRDAAFNDIDWGWVEKQ